MIKLEVSRIIKGELRKTLWEVCCSSFPHIVMSEDSDIDSDTWVVEKGDTTEEDYLAEQEILRDCIINCKCLVISQSENWLINKKSHHIAR